MKLFGFPSKFHMGTNVTRIIKRNSDCGFIKKDMNRLNGRGYGYLLFN